MQVRKQQLELDMEQHFLHLVCKTSISLYVQKIELVGQLERNDDKVVQSGVLVVAEEKLCLS